ncbi:MAG: hypothetical protein HWE27_13500 [Gammaproteobacteria bacterium]|nr:hypothetical protein [Gammaproteobacteria bacterium]
MAGLPVGCVTFALLYWANRKGLSLRKEERQNTHTDKADADSSTANKKQAKKLKKQQKKANGLVINKWLSFGGGFYGVMAFVTYIHVEVLDIWAAFSQFNGLSDFLTSLSVSFFIGLIFEAFKNFITAIIWFNYWGEYLPITNGWLWIGVCYVAFISAEKLMERLYYKSPVV